MNDASLTLFESINQYSDLESLIENGQAENLYLECKAPSSPKFGRDQKANLAKIISGFSNTNGGVVIWGISTSNNLHDGLDILVQIEPVGTCKNFAARLSSNIPMLTTPPVLNISNKVIMKKANDTKGVILTHIPKYVGDPIQSNEDNMFYFRSGHEFTVAPYEMIHRLFLSTISPDLFPSIAVDLIKLNTVPDLIG